MQKIAWDGPKWGREVLFAANTDLADILGRTDFDFENFDFFDLFGVPNFWLGPTWAPRGWAHHLGPTWAHPLGPHGWAGGPLGWTPRVGPRG